VFSLAVARPAARLVGVEGADQDCRAVERRRLAVDEPLRHRPRAAAAMADRLELVDELSHAEKRRHWAEPEAAEVLRQARGDDARPGLDEAVDRVDDAVVEELHLVDPDGVVAHGEALHVLARRRRHSAHSGARMGDDVAHVVAVVDRRLDDEGALAGDLRAPEAADELLALPAEHGTADHLEPAPPRRPLPDHGPKLTAPADGGRVPSLRG